MSFFPDALRLIFATFLLIPGFMFAASGDAALVTNTNDSGPGSLRQAILDVNSQAAPGRIEFNIRDSGPHKIAPLTPLPRIMRNAVIDGYTQRGARVNTSAQGINSQLMIEISGENIPTAVGLTWAGANVNLRGLTLNRWKTAIEIGCPSCPFANGSVTGCLIGTDPAGAIPRTNEVGIAVYDAATIMIGGLLPADRNLIANSRGAGLRLYAGVYNSVLGNAVYGNGGLAIDLGNEGPDLNDISDWDGGPNQGQNKPVLIEAAVVGANLIQISGGLFGKRSSTNRVQLFYSPNFLPSGRPQAALFIGERTLVTDAQGGAGFQGVFQVPATNGFITGTATDDLGNTSEISDGAAIGDLITMTDAYPFLSISRTTNQVRLRWLQAPLTSRLPFLYGSYRLQMSEDLQQWRDFGPASPAGADVFLGVQQLALSSLQGQRFFRMKVSQNWSNASFANLNLSGALFAGANFRNADLRGAVLTQSDLIGADLRGADLAGANLTGANLSHANLTGASLEGALLDGARLDGTTFGRRQGRFVLTRLPNTTPDEPASTCIPAIAFQPRTQDYALGHSRMPSVVISYNTVALVFKSGTTAQQANGILQTAKARIVGGVQGGPTSGPGVLIVQLPTTNHAQLELALGSLRAHPEVKLALADVKQDTQALPPDETVNRAPNWNWDRTSPISATWGLVECYVPQLWNLNAALAKRHQPQAILTGIIDMGYCAQAHDDVNFSFPPPQNTSQDPSALAHGTAVAGTIGAHFSNKLGMEGVNPFAVLYPELGSTWSEHITSLQTLTEAGVKLINISLGSNAPEDPTEKFALEEGMETAGLLFQSAMQSLEERFGADHLPLLVIAAGNNGGQDCRFSSPSANAAARGLIANAITVQAMNVNRRRAPFSNTGADLSAPGVALSSTACNNSWDSGWEGTSAAAPHVTGLAGYLFALDPTLTIPEVKELLLANAKVTEEAPLIHAFDSALDIDRLRGNDCVLRMLLDIDDGTLDGNQRLAPSGNADYLVEDFDGDGGPGDGQIDMSDFRRWRDWLLQAEFARKTNSTTPTPQLDGSPAHPKKDSNGDGIVGDRDIHGNGTIDAYELEYFPRGDFNGDGSISRDGENPVAGYLQGTVGLTDLQVLQSRFDDPHYLATELPPLIHSGDVLIDAYLLLQEDVREVKSFVYLQGSEAVLDSTTHTPEATAFVYTLPVNLTGYRIRVQARNAAGDVVQQLEKTFDVQVGSDHVWVPLGGNGLKFQDLTTQMSLAAWVHLEECTFKWPSEPCFEYELRHSQGGFTSGGLRQRTTPESVQPLHDEAIGMVLSGDSTGVQQSWGVVSFSYNAVPRLSADGGLIGLNAQCSGDWLGGRALVCGGNLGRCAPWYYFYGFTTVNFQTDWRFTTDSPFIIRAEGGIHEALKFVGSIAGHSVDSTLPNWGLPPSLPPGTYYNEVRLCLRTESACDNTYYGGPIQESFVNPIVFLQANANWQLTFTPLEQGSP